MTELIRDNTERLDQLAMLLEENKAYQRSLDRRQKNLVRMQRSLDRRQKNLVRMQRSLDRRQKNLVDMQRSPDGARKTWYVCSAPWTGARKNLVRMQRSLDRRQKNLVRTPCLLGLLPC